MAKHLLETKTREKKHYNGCVILWGIDNKGGLILEINKNILEGGLYLNGQLESFKYTTP